MKFNWGTGIFLFLIVFLVACGIFIYFAMTQQVNLVHKDYYEKGVDYGEQIKVNARSKQFAHSFDTKSNDQFFIVDINESLVTKMDSGTIQMFRPSDKTKDISTSFKTSDKTVSTQFQFDKRALLSGRYILKITWFMEGEKYEVDQPVNVQ
jgi:hypothetical protein